MAQQNGNNKGFSGILDSISVGEKKIQMVLKIHNTADRAMHFITDVRTLRYDAASQQLTVSLSDEGREVIPGAAAKLPVFRHIDPGDEAEIYLEVPKRIVKLSRAGLPGALGFESQELTNAVNVIVNVAYADVPYYQDTRETKSTDLPAVVWQQSKLVLTKSFSAK